MNQITRYTLGLIVAGSFNASAVTIAGATSDGLARFDGTGDLASNLGSAQVRVGDFVSANGNNVFITSTVYAFELPDLGPVAAPFATGSLSFTLNTLDANGGGGYNGDLYGIDARASSAIVAADYYAGAADDPAANATKLQDSILTDTTALGVVTSGDIAAFLNAQYDSGSNIGEFVFLRLNKDNDVYPFAESSGYLVTTANDGDVAERPVINFTVAPIPEPSSAALLGLGSLALLRRRR